MMCILCGYRMMLVLIFLVIMLWCLRRVKLILSLENVWVVVSLIGFFFIMMMLIFIVGGMGMIVMFIIVLFLKILEMKVGRGVVWGFGYLLFMVGGGYLILLYNGLV